MSSYQYSTKGVTPPDYATSVAAAAPSGPGVELPARVGNGNRFLRVSDDGQGVYWSSLAPD